MTFKSPYDELSAAELEKIEVPGVRLPHRQVWGCSPFIAWVTGTLPDLEADQDPRSPAMQVAAFLQRFIAGDHMLIKGDRDGGEGVRLMRPDEAGIWELCVWDVRVFGWFWRSDLFIASNAGYTKQIKDYGLYGGFRGEAMRLREQLSLSLPSHISGQEYKDVLSDRS